MQRSCFISVLGIIFRFFVCFWRDSPPWVRASSFTRFLDHKQRRSIVGRSPLDEWSACRRHHLTTHNTQYRQTTPGGIRTHNPSMWAAADLGLRPRGHCDGQFIRRNIKRNIDYLDRRRWMNKNLIGGNNFNALNIYIDRFQQFIMTRSASVDCTGMSCRWYWWRFLENRMPCVADTQKSVKWLDCVQ